MNGPSNTTVPASANNFGTNASVASLICVTACTTEINSPTNNETASNGPPNFNATTFELRISILEAKAAATGVPVPGKVLEFLAHKITSNVRELEGALNRLVAHANLFDRPVTLEATQEVLHDMLKAHDRRVSIDEIQRRVAEHYNIRLTDMASPRRARNVARPRQVAMYLAKQLTSRSLPEIGRKFGNRDHTTVMHAVSRVGELMERDVTFAEDVDLLRRMLEA